MKLPIKHEYFTDIKSGKKEIEFRDAHITFIDEDNQEELQKRVVSIKLLETKTVLDLLSCWYPNKSREELQQLFTDDMVIKFVLE